MNNRYNPLENQNRKDRMMQRLAAELDEKVGGRADMYISDALALDRDTAYAMINFEGSIGPVSSQDVIAFVEREFAGKVRPVLETAKLHKDNDCVVVALTKVVATRPLADAKGMIAIAAGVRYLDTELKATWDVAKSPDGKEYLRRASDDDVSAMVAERRQRLAVAGAQVLTIAAALGSGCSLADVGDTVRCYWQGHMHHDCEVKAVVAGNKLSVKIPTVGTVTVAREAVEVVAVSKQKAGEMKRKLKEYWTKALPDSGYAKELTNELIDEGTG